MTWKGSHNFYGNERTSTAGVFHPTVYQPPQQYPTPTHSTSSAHTVSSSSQAPHAHGAVDDYEGHGHAKGTPAVSLEQANLSRADANPRYGWFKQIFKGHRPQHSTDDTHAHAHTLHRRRPLAHRQYSASVPDLSTILSDSQSLSRYPQLGYPASYSGGGGYGGGSGYAGGSGGGTGPTLLHAHPHPHPHVSPYPQQHQRLPERTSKHVEAINERGVLKNPSRDARSRSSGSSASESDGYPHGTPPNGVSLAGYSQPLVYGYPPKQEHSHPHQHPHPHPHHLHPHPHPNQAPPPPYSYAPTVQSYPSTTRSRPRSASASASQTQAPSVFYTDYGGSREHLGVPVASTHHSSVGGSGQRVPSVGGGSSVQSPHGTEFYLLTQQGAYAPAAPGPYPGAGVGGVEKVGSEGRRSHRSERGGRSGKEKEREREKEKEKEKDGHRHHHREREGEKEKEKERRSRSRKREEKEKDRDREKDKERRKEERKRTSSVPRTSTSTSTRHTLIRRSSSHPPHGTYAHEHHRSAHAMPVSTSGPIPIAASTSVPTSKPIPIPGTSTTAPIPVSKASSQAEYSGDLGGHYAIHSPNHRYYDARSWNPPSVLATSPAHLAVHPHPHPSPATSYAPSHASYAPSHLSHSSYLSHPSHSSRGSRSRSADPKHPRFELPVMTADGEYLRVREEVGRESRMPLTPPPHPRPFEVRERTWPVREAVWRPV